MDLGSLPELAQHFTAAATSLYHFIPDLTQNFTAVVSSIYNHIPDMMPTSVCESSKNVWTAMFVTGAMSGGQKMFQSVKLATATATLGASVATGNVAGIAASLIADGEVLIELERAGDIYRKAHSPGP